MKIIQMWKCLILKIKEQLFLIVHKITRTLKFNSFVNCWKILYKTTKTSVIKVFLKLSAYFESTEALLKTTDNIPLLDVIIHRFEALSLDFSLVAISFTMFIIIILQQLKTQFWLVKQCFVVTYCIFTCNNFDCFSYNE